MCSTTLEPNFSLMISMYFGFLKYSLKALSRKRRTSAAERHSVDKSNVSSGYCASPCHSSGNLIPLRKGHLHITENLGKALPTKPVPPVTKSSMLITLQGFQCLAQSYIPGSFLLQ